MTVDPCRIPEVFARSLSLGFLGEGSETVTYASMRFFAVPYEMLVPPEVVVSSDAQQVPVLDFDVPGAGAPVTVAAPGSVDGSLCVSAGLSRPELLWSVASIPDSVVRFGTADGTAGTPGCFEGTGLSGVFSPRYEGSGVHLGPRCFRGTLVDRIDEGFLSRVAERGDECFALCPRLESVSGMAHLPGAPAGCFRGCVSLRSLAGGVCARQDLFGQVCGDAAFEGCTGLRSVEGFGTVPSLGERCFRRCTSLVSLAGFAGRPWPAGSDPSARFGDRAFESCSGLVTLGCPDAPVVSLGDRCFRACTSLRDLDGLPLSLESLGTGCFRDCTALRDISALGGAPALDAIPARCFDGDWLVSVVPDLSGRTVRLGDRCFRGCVGVRNLDWIDFSLLSTPDVLSGTGVSDIGRYVFAECARSAGDVSDSDAVEVWRAGFRIVHAGSESDSDSDSDSDIDRPSDGLYGLRSARALGMAGPSFRSIPDGMFSGCGALEEAATPRWLTFVGDFAFDGCQRLREFLSFDGSDSDSGSDGAFGVQAYPSGAQGSGTSMLRVVGDPGLVAVGTCAFRGCHAVQLPGFSRVTARWHRYARAVAAVELERVLDRMFPELSDDLVDVALRQAPDLSAAVASMASDLVRMDRDLPLSPSSGVGVLECMMTSVVRPVFGWTGTVAIPGPVFLRQDGSSVSLAVRILARCSPLDVDGSYGFDATVAPVYSVVLVNANGETKAASADALMPDGSHAGGCVPYGVSTPFMIPLDIGFATGSPLPSDSEAYEAGFPDAVTLVFEHGRPGDGSDTDFLDVTCQAHVSCPRRTVVPDGETEPPLEYYAPVDCRLEVLHFAPAIDGGTGYVLSDDPVCLLAARFLDMWVSLAPAFSLQFSSTFQARVSNMQRTGRPGDILGAVMGYEGAVRSLLQAAVDGLVDREGLDLCVDAACTDVMDRFPRQLASTSSFEGCRMESFSGMRWLPQPVPDACFAESGINNLSSFANATGFGVGVFRDTRVSLDVWPQAVRDVSSGLFRNVTSVVSAAVIPDRVGFASWCMAGTSLRTLECDSQAQQYLSGLDLVETKDLVGGAPVEVNGFAGEAWKVPDLLGYRFRAIPKVAAGAFAYTLLDSEGLMRDWSVPEDADLLAAGDEIPVTLYASTTGLRTWGWADEDDPGGLSVLPVEVDWDRFPDSDSDSDGESVNRPLRWGSSPAGTAIAAVGPDERGHLLAFRLSGLRFEAETDLDGSVVEGEFPCVCDTGSGSVSDGGSVEFIDRKLGLDQMLDFYCYTPMLDMTEEIGKEALIDAEKRGAVVVGRPVTGETGGRTGRPGAMDSRYYKGLPFLRGTAPHYSSSYVTVAAPGVLIVGSQVVWVRPKATAHVKLLNPGSDPADPFPRYGVKVDMSLAVEDVAPVMTPLPTRLASVWFPEFCDSMFEGCQQITDLDWIPRNITRLPSRCFWGCRNVSRADVPSWVESVADDCFGPEAQTSD